MTTLTPEQAAARVHAGDVVRMVVSGHSSNPPTLMVRMGKAYGDTYVLTTAVSGWCEGVTEPVCLPESDFLTRSFFVNAAALDIEPDGRNVHHLPETYDS